MKGEGVTTGRFPNRKRLNVATVATFYTQNVATVAMFNTQNVATVKGILAKDISCLVSMESWRPQEFKLSVG